MCDWKQGDQVAYIGNKGIPRREDHISSSDIDASTILTVKTMAPWKDTDVIAFLSAEHPGRWFDARAFRPVTRTRDTLSIESFMTIKTGQPEGPRRVVVEPKKEEV